MIPVASNSPCATDSMSPRRSIRVLVPVMLRRTDSESHEVFLWQKLYLLHHYKERGLPWDTSIFTLTVEKKLCHSLVSTLTQSKKLWRKRSKINKELQDRILPSWITDPNQGHYYLQDCYPLQFIDTDEVKANIKKNPMLSLVAVSDDIRNCNQFLCIQLMINV